MPKTPPKPQPTPAQLNHYMRAAQWLAGQPPQAWRSTDRAELTERALHETR